MNILPYKTADRQEHSFIRIQCGAIRDDGSKSLDWCGFEQ